MRARRAGRALRRERARRVDDLRRPARAAAAPPCEGFGPLAAGRRGRDDRREGDRPRPADRQRPARGDPEGTPAVDHASSARPGKLDVDGRVFPSQNAGAAPSVEWVVGGKPEAQGLIATGAGQRAASSRPAGGPPPMGYDLKLTVRDGTLRPFGRTFEATGVDGGAATHPRPARDRARRRPARRRRAGRAREHRLAAAASRASCSTAPPPGWRSTPPCTSCSPARAKRGWDETQPQGTLDAEVHYDSVALDAARGATSLAARRTPRRRPRPTAPTSPPAFASCSSPASSPPR